MGNELQPFTRGVSKFSKKTHVFKFKTLEWGPLGAHRVRGWDADIDAQVPQPAEAWSFKTFQGGCRVAPKADLCLRMETQNPKTRAYLVLHLLHNYRFH